MAKFRVIIDEERCKGCCLCVKACPKSVLIIDTNRVNNKSINPAKVENIESCIGCTMCAISCPDAAIEVYEEGYNG